MVGDVCNADWLSEQLMLAVDDAGETTVRDDGEGVSRGSDDQALLYEHPEKSDIVDEELLIADDCESQIPLASLETPVSVCCPNCPCDRQRVVVLDCRSPADYLASHIVGAVHLAVPQLMLRRLKSGHLPASSVIGCLQDEGRENFNHRWKSEMIVLHDECSNDVINDANSCSVPPTSSDVVSVLLKRLKEDGCRVCLLEGGYDMFSQKYPQLCVTATSGTLSSVDQLDNDDGINVDDGDDDDLDELCRDGECLTSASVKCRSAPATSTTTTTALGIQRLRLQRHNRHNRPLVSHRLASHHHHQGNLHHHHNSHHSIGSCTKQFSCPSSLSSSSLSTGCTSSSSSNSPLSISSCPVNEGSASGRMQQEAFPVEVLPYLYLGNARSSADIEALRRNGIRYILNVTPDVPNSFAGTEAFRYLQIPIDDHWSQDLTTYFPDAIAFIDEARRSRCGVLVHCLAGVSRSVTVTVAYLMHVLRLTLNDAFDHVRRCKPDISPNFSFMGQLLDYERLLSTERDRQLTTAADEVAPSVGASSTAFDQLVPSSGVTTTEAYLGPGPLAAVAEPVGDHQSMFQSPQIVPRSRHGYSDCSNCRCPSSFSVGVSSTSPAIDRQVPKRNCDVCCRAYLPVGGSGRGQACAAVGADLSDAGATSCYSSPVSSLSSLSSSNSGVNQAVSSTSSSSSSAFDYDTIPMSLSPSPMSNFS